MDRTTAAAPVWPQHGGLPQPLAETIPTGAASWLYGPDGAAYAQIDATGAVTATVTYDPYGTVAASTATAPRIGFVGAYTDPIGKPLLKVRSRSKWTTAAFPLGVSATTTSGSSLVGARLPDRISTGVAVVGGLGCMISTGGVGTAICVSAMIAGLELSYIDGEASGDFGNFQRDLFLTASLGGLARCVRSDDVARLVMEAGATSLDSLLNGLEAVGLDDRRF